MCVSVKRMQRLPSYPLRLNRWRNLPDGEVSPRGGARLRRATLRRLHRSADRPVASCRGMSVGLSQVPVIVFMPNIESTGGVAPVGARFGFVLGSFFARTRVCGVESRIFGFVS